MKVVVNRSSYGSEGLFQIAHKYFRGSILYDRHRKEISEYGNLYIKDNIFNKSYSELIDGVNYYFYSEYDLLDDISRSDEKLIEIVENFDGDCSYKVVEIPDGIEYEIISMGDSDYELIVEKGHMW